jgi:tetratricopeptide (TPR) repeat protein
MKRILPALVCCCVVGLGRAPAVRAQSEVTYFDRTAKKELKATGDIQTEAPNKIVVKPSTAAGTREIPAVDIVDVIYEVPARIRLDYTAARGEERKIDTTVKEEDRKKAVEDAIKSYQKLLRDMTGEKTRPAARHLQYKIARLLARAAEDDDSQVDAAIEALAKFRKEHPDGWQISNASRLLARLLADKKKDFDGAQKVYAELAATPNLAKETKQECDLLVARALTRGKKFVEAEKLLQDVLKAVPSDDPQATRARIALAECHGCSGKLDEAVKLLEDLIARTADNDLKAAAYNALGDCYRENNRPKDALWPYLFVDVVYHQDKREHARAVEQLARLFAELGDKERAEQYRERMKKGIK